MILRSSAAKLRFFGLDKASLPSKDGPPRSTVFLLQFWLPQARLQHDLTQELHI